MRRRLFACIRCVTLCSAIIAGLVVSSSLAQTVIAVPFDTSRLTWDVPPSDAQHSPPTKHTITCGASTVDVPMPATSIPVSQVVSQVGVYTCSIYASNTFGRQTEPDVIFPTFEAGLVPLPPSTPRLEAIP